MPGMRLKGWRILASVVLWMIGIVFLLLLNGQVFTNTLVFIGCVAASAVCWLPLMFDVDVRRRAAALIALHVFLLSIAVGFLPGNYQAQTRWNDGVRRFLEKRRERTDELLLKKNAGQNSTAGHNPNR